MAYVAVGLKYLFLGLSLTILTLVSIGFYGYIGLNDLDAISSLLHESFSLSAICTISSQAQFWKDVAEKDEGQVSTNPHILAARIQARGGTITHTDINSVLANQNIAITAEELVELKSIPYVTHELTVLDYIKGLFKLSATHMWCIYMFISPTNGFYVGSSEN